MEKKAKPSRQKSPEGGLVRQTILLPRDLKQLVARESYTYGISQNELISRALRAYLEREEAGSVEQPDDDFESIVGLFGKGLPEDLAAEHDKYIYGKGGR